MFELIFTFKLYKYKEIFFKLGDVNLNVGFDSQIDFPPSYFTFWMLCCLMYSIFLIFFSFAFSYNK